MSLTHTSRRGIPRIVWQVALSAGLVALAVTSAGVTPTLIALLYLAAITPELVRVDFAEHRLPNRLVLPGYGASAVALAGEWALGNPPLVPLIAGAAYFVFLFAFSLAGGMGMGDVKLAGVLGLCSATVTTAIASPVIAFLLGGVVSAIVLVRGGRGSRIPFGPFMLAGFWLAAGIG